MISIFCTAKWRDERDFRVALHHLREQAIYEGCTTQLNSSRFPRTNPDIMLASGSVSIENDTENRPNPTGRAPRRPALNPGTCVCACFTSTPRLFADSKLCRTMPAAPLSHSWIIKRWKTERSPDVLLSVRHRDRLTPQPILVSDRSRCLYFSKKERGGGLAFLIYIYDKV